MNGKLLLSLKKRQLTGVKEGFGYLLKRHSSNNVTYCYSKRCSIVL